MKSLYVKFFFLTSQNSIYLLFCFDMTTLLPYPSHYLTSTAYYGSLIQLYNIFKIVYTMYEGLEYHIKRFEAGIS